MRRTIVVLSLALSACDSASRAHASAVDTARVVVRAPADSTIPVDALGISVRRGRAILEATRDSLPKHVGSNLRCTSCHLDGGARAYAAPLVGSFVRYPQYRPRTAAVVRIEDRINDCLRRSMNGAPIPFESSEMRDMVAYLAWLSRGIAPPGTMAGQGLVKLGALAGDSTRGAIVFAGNCARCHGADGAGIASLNAPALWGDRSFNVGASMARVSIAAAFVRHNMPLDKPNSLTDQQAFDVAAFIESHPRPDLKGKENDWPAGGAPADAPYRTIRGARE